MMFTDERVSVESTTIPHHLEQMINVLQQEEQENGTASAVGTLSKQSCLFLIFCSYLCLCSD